MLGLISDDMEFVLTGCGTTAIVDGLGELTGILHEPGKVVERDGAFVVTTEPTFVVSAELAELIDKNTTVLTINGTDYVCFQKVPDGCGAVELDLTGDF